MKFFPSSQPPTIFKQSGKYIIVRGKILTFRIERSAIISMESINKNKSAVMREAINRILQEGITKDDILNVTASIPIVGKRQVAVKVDEETLEKLKRIAEENGLLLSELLRIAVWKYLLEEGVVNVEPF